MVEFVPLCLDALSARLAQQAGFSKGYVSGGALGYAHAVSEALLTLDELCDVVRHVVARSDLQVIADAGVGFGDAAHMSRTVTQLEAAGAWAIEIEDQVAPKRVSHHRGIEELVSLHEMVDKIEVANESRKQAMIIARTSAFAHEDLESALERAQAYVGAGADMILLVARGAADWRAVNAVLSVPLVTFGTLDASMTDQWESFGVDYVIDPFSAQVLQVEALQSLYGSFAAGQAPAVNRKKLFEVYNELDTLAGFDGLYAIEDRTVLGKDTVLGKE